MIDLHCHILPGVDDGAASEKESCLMAQLAVDSGVTIIAMTPHCNVPGQFDNYTVVELVKRMERFQWLLQQRGIPLQLRAGMEVYVTPELPALLDRRQLLTLGGSHYLLVEFGFDESPQFISRMLRTVQNYGLIPVVAHPERYYCVQDDTNMLRQWSENNIALQINKGSFFGSFGRRAARTAHWCLNEGCLHLIGSDAHSPYVRTTKMAEIWAYIAETASPEIADFLLEKNPQSILDDDSIRPVMAEF